MFGAIGFPKKPVKIVPDLSLQPSPVLVVVTNRHAVIGFCRILHDGRLAYVS